MIYLAQPFGQVPAIEDGDLKLYGKLAGKEELPYSLLLL